MMSDQAFLFHVLIDFKQPDDQKNIQKRKDRDQGEQEKKTIGDLTAGNGDPRERKKPQCKKNQPAASHDAILSEPERAGSDRSESDPHCHD